MKLRFWVVSTGSTSMRDSLNAILEADRPRSWENCKYPVQIVREKKQGRSPGWSSVHSRFQGGWGAIKYRWNGTLNILECWAVTRNNNPPHQLIGEFIQTVMHSQGKKVKSIHIEVR